MIPNMGPADDSKMEAMGESIEVHRGAALLLAHLALLSEPDDRPPAADRLEQAVGRELAELLQRGFSQGQTRSRRLVA
jgi:hypothetical protein